jgi:feruloyl esterase
VNPRFALTLIIIIVATFTALPLAAASCDSLASLALPDAAVTSAQVVAAGAFTAPGGRGTARDAGAYKDLPAFCRVSATLKPSSDSDIKIEVWLPVGGWNGKFQGVGNGGWAGVISYSALAEGVRRGYATASTDTGHVGATGSFAIEHPEKLIDFGYRSEHEMTVKGKAITEAFYGSAPRYSYWNGCSTGGRQGLKEAQRFPNDYDGIVAGDPANPRTRLSSWELWLAHATLKDPASYIPLSKYPMVHKAVLEACDAIDGLKDGLIDDPTKCHFDPKVLECKGADGPDCLTTPQMEAARKLLSPLKNPRTGEELYPGLEPGTELGWKVGAGGPEPFAPAVDQYKYVVFKNPDWDWRTLNFDSDVALADKTDHDTINAIDPNIKTFIGHGGKLITYHGWSDPNVAPLASVNYYKSVVDSVGSESKTRDSFRLFMAPGMGHCGGGEGPNTFDMLSAMEQWVEKGKAPDQVIATHVESGVKGRTRPLCPYPQVAKYKGSGSIEDAANFACREP